MDTRRDQLPYCPGHNGLYCFYLHRLGLDNCLNFSGFVNILKDAEHLRFSEEKRNLYEALGMNANAESIIGEILKSRAAALQLTPQVHELLKRARKYKAEGAENTHTRRIIAGDLLFCDLQKLSVRIT